jgi:hypothetical protein
MSITLCCLIYEVRHDGYAYLGQRDDRLLLPKKRKVGSATPPLTTSSGQGAGMPTWPIEGAPSTPPRRSYDRRSPIVTLCPQDVARGSHAGILAPDHTAVVDPLAAVLTGVNACT